MLASTAIAPLNEITPHLASDLLRADIQGSSTAQIEGNHRLFLHSKNSNVDWYVSKGRLIRKTNRYDEKEQRMIRHAGRVAQGIEALAVSLVTIRNHTSIMGIIKTEAEKIPFCAVLGGKKE